MTTILLGPGETFEEFAYRRWLEEGTQDWHALYVKARGTREYAASVARISELTPEEAAVLEAEGPIFSFIKDGAPTLSVDAAAQPDEPPQPDDLRDA